MQTFTNAIAGFILHCKHEKNLTPKTLQCYSTDLSQFESFALKSGSSAELSKIDKELLRKYLEYIGHSKPKTIKRKIASLKAFFNFHTFEEHIQSNPFHKMRIKIKEPKVLPTVLQVDEIESILLSAYQQYRLSALNHSYEHFACLRDVAVIELLFATGVRVSELSSLQRENVDIATGTIKVRGKGAKERVIQICDVEILGILTTYSACSITRFDTRYKNFFINRHGNRLSEQSIRTLVRKHTQNTRITKRVTPHVFRHSLATLLLEEGVDVTFIQKILGHSSISTTQIYTHVSNKSQKAILSLKHPRRHFNCQTSK
jgi:integrase/recombinase XerD